MRVPIKNETLRMPFYEQQGIPEDTTILPKMYETVKHSNVLSVNKYSELEILADNTFFVWCYL